MSIAFRSVRKETVSKCKCGRPTTTWISFEKQYRVNGKGPWRKVPEAETLLKQLHK